MAIFLLWGFKPECFQDSVFKFILCFKGISICGHLELNFFFLKLAKAIYFLASNFSLLCHLLFSLSSLPLTLGIYPFFSPYFALMGFLLRNREIYAVYHV